MDTPRSSYWDNTKALLMFLVVLGHYYAFGFVYPQEQADSWALPQAIVSWVYLFHMPLFAFISGYFSKNVQKCRATAASQLLLPYLVFNTLCVLLDHVVSDSVLNPLFYPVGAMWYPMALFLWRTFAPDLHKLRHSWLWALALSLLCSWLSPGKNWWLLGNCINFLPFFLLGLETGPEQIQQIRRLPKVLCALVLGAALAGMYLLVRRGFVPSQLGFFVESFTLTRAGLRQGVIILLRYIVALVLGICFLNLMPQKRSYLSVLGQNTMTILLLHNLPGLRELLYRLDPFRDPLPLSMLWWLLWAVVATVLLGSPPVARAYRWAMDALRRHIPRASIPAGNTPASKKN
jgi:fucose 4-O-acetylase-like acetyltransferase